MVHYLIRTVGRAVYDKQVHLWNVSTGKAADFTTSFNFSMQKMGNDPIDGDGFACFLAKNGSQVPAKFHGGCFGLISNCTYTPTDGLLAVQFHTFKNTFDQGSSDFGIDINSIHSPYAMEINRPLNDGSRVHVIFPKSKPPRNYNLGSLEEESPLPLSAPHSLTFTSINAGR